MILVHTSRYDIYHKKHKNSPRNLPNNNNKKRSLRCSPDLKNVPDPQFSGKLLAWGGVKHCTVAKTSVIHLICECLIVLAACMILDKAWGSNIIFLTNKGNRTKVTAKLCCILNIKIYNILVHLFIGSRLVFSQNKYSTLNKEWRGQILWARL